MKRKPVDVFYAYDNTYIGGVIKRIIYGFLYDHLEDINNETD